MNPARVQLLEANLIQCPAMRDRTSRDVLVNGLSPNLQRLIQRNEDDHIDVRNILDVCMASPDGMKELFSMLQYLDGYTPQLQKVHSTWQGMYTTSYTRASVFSLIAVGWMIVVILSITSGAVILSKAQTLLAFSPAIIIIVYLIVNWIQKIITGIQGKDS